ncbi:hypothetical protein [Streptococcus sp. 79]|nr:hypothetical protein [Streptococcus sp. 79]
MTFLLLILNENQKANEEASTGCSKHRFEVADRTDEVSNIYIRQGEADVV